jgi:hypothetical protein
LKEKLQQEKHFNRQIRLQALYLVVTGEAKSRTKVAGLLSKNRNTISDWFSLDSTLDKNS